MAALIFGLKQFKTYLLGRRVDNLALTYYQRMKDPIGQAARYLEILSNYDFEIEHRSGARHVNADSISRLRPCEVDGGGPCKQCNKRVTGRHAINAVQTRAQRTRMTDDGVADTAALDAEPVIGACANGGRGTRRRRRPRTAAALNVTAPAAWEVAAGWSLSSIRDMQLADNDIAPALMWIEAGSRPPWATGQGLSPMLRA